MLTLFRNLFSPPRHLILVIIAAWIGLSLAEKRAERYGVSKNDVNILAFYGLIAFIIGGRLSFALQNIPAFAKGPLGIFSVNPDLFDPFGAVAVAFITLLIFGQRHNLSIWSSFDALTPFFVVLTAGIGLSHLAAGTAFGNPTKLPWGINLWNATRHPTQIYEILASLFIFALLWFRRPTRQPGIDFLTFASLFSISQLFLSAFRANSTLILNGYREERVISWIVLAISFVSIEIRFKESKKG
jgi:phosphatidylglycerol---prolipoprotein diacylglyceryl transferase